METRVIKLKILKEEEEDPKLYKIFKRDGKLDPGSMPNSYIRRLKEIIGEMK